MGKYKDPSYYNPQMLLSFFAQAAPSVFEWFEDAYSLSIVLEHLKGGDLLTTVERTSQQRLQLTERWIAGVLRQAPGVFANRAVALRGIKTSVHMLPEFRAFHYAIYDRTAPKLQPHCAI